MTGPATGVPDRSSAAPTRTSETRNSASAILIVLALGLALRLIIAYILPGSGFKNDIAAFGFWAQNLAENGPAGFYHRGFFIDYTPGYLYALWLVGIVEKVLPQLDLLKIPAILADMAVAWLIWSLVRDLGGGRRAALIGAALYLFVPVTWFDSVVWGQVDSVGLVFLLLAVRALWRDQPELAVVLTVVAGIVKIQLGVVLVPITAAVLLRRYLWDPLSAPGRPPAGAATEGSATAARSVVGSLRGRGPARLLTSLGAGLVTAAAMGAPFSLSILDLIEQVRKTAGGYPYLTVNAYNPWALVSQAGSGLAATGQWLCDSVTGTAADTTCPPGSATLVGPIWAVFVGDGLLILVALLVGLMVARHPDRLTILVGLAVLTIAFFVVPTRVHERYMFPLFAVAAVLAGLSWRWLVAYLVLAGAAFANMYVVLTTLYPGNPGISDWLGIGPAIRSSTGVATVAVVHLLGLAWAGLQLRRGAREALEDEVLDAWEDDADGDEAVAGSADLRPPDPTRKPAPAAVLAAPIASGPGGVTPAGAPFDPGTGLTAEAPRVGGPPAPLAGTPARPEAVAGAWAPRPPAVAAALGEPVTPPATRPPTAGQMPPDRAGHRVAGQDVDGWGAPDLLGPIRRRLMARPLRADRSRQLDGEPGGRFDRLDLWLVVWLVIASLVLRTWRLAEPASMHFDEVYHARTATEFLQDWRYNLPHSIYEFTHPHLAKYAIAAGIVIWGDDQVTATSDLGTGVADAAIEPRWDDPELPDHRAGDRLYVATTGGELRAYDLQTRSLVATFPVPGIAAVAVDTSGHRVFAGTADGSVYELDTTTTLDPYRGGAPPSSLAPPTPIGTFGSAVRRLLAPEDGDIVVAITAAGDVASMEAESGTALGRVHLAGASDLAPAGTTDGLVADMAQVTDPAAEAAVLAGLIDGDAKEIEGRLAAGTTRVILAGTVDDATRTAVESAIADGRLNGMSFQPLASVAVADSAGVTIVAAADATVADEVPIAGGATGLALTANLDAPRLYVASGQTVTIVKLAADQATPTPPAVEATIQMPGAVSRVTFDAASVMVHVLGTTPDGSANTIYVIEPHGNAVYADARLPFSPAAWATDVQPDYPVTDRQVIYALSSSGTIASVDIGNHETSWRLPGVIAGALTSGLLFLLARILFRRRSIGVLVAILSLADGMLFVQSRIAMNDVYVGLFIVAAYVLFAGLWTGRWRSWKAFWVILPVIGVLLGLALASKWVAAYAIAAMGLLILVRSALGRTLTILALLGATVYLGYQGLVVAPSTPAEPILSGPNFLFMFLMIGLTLIATVVTVLHPIAWSVDEVRFAIGAPAAAGVVLGLVAIPLGGTQSTIHLGPLDPSLTTAMEAAIALLFVAIGAFVAFTAAGWLGFGPLAPPLAPDDPAQLAEPPAAPPAGWLRLGSGFGLPAAWMAICLVAVPVAVYIVSYIPWALDSGGLAGSPLIFPKGTPLIGAWPPGHDGQTLWQLTQAMYAYHNNLRAAHAAASPWWAWPFDLKPVWFYQGSFAGGTSAAIYDAGNLVTWWLGIPAMAFVAWQAFKRRSLGLSLVLVAFLFQWLSWSRIDRATFQYHYYTSVPFVLLGLAYLLAELWHGASSRTWLMARVAAAVALMGPGLMWVAKAPLCTLVDVNRAYKDSPACVGEPANLLITARVGGVVAAVIIGIAIVVYQLAHLEPRGGRRGDGGRSDMTRLLATAVVAGAVVLVLGFLLGDQPIVNIRGLPTLMLAIVTLAILGSIAWFIVTARDARRFVMGAIVAAVAEFLLFYPNIAALPMPSTIFNAYQGLLPTYLYPFQFPVNTDPVPKIPSLFAADPNLLNLWPGPVLGVVLVFACLLVGYSAWSWRIALAGRSEPGPYGTTDGRQPG